MADPTPEPLAPPPVRHFEDIVEGESHRFPPRRMERESILRFANEFDRLPFHLDEASAKQTLFGGLIASGLHTVCVAASIVVDEFLRHTSMIGSAGMRDVKWLKPVRPGDSVSVHLTVVKTEPWPGKARLGRVRCALTVLNQHEEAVATALVDYLFTCCHPAPS